VADLKSDGETAFLSRVRSMPNLSVQTGRTVTELLGDPADPQRIGGVRLEDGSEVRAQNVLLAAGALHSPRLLQRYVDAHQLSTRLPCAAHIGRNLKYHLLTAMIGIGSGRMTDVIRKTRIFLNSDLPHSSVQPLGFDAELIGTLIPGFVPRAIARLLGNRAYGFFLQTEDGAHRDNRVIEGSPTSDLPPCIDYDAARTPAAAEEHRRLVRGFSSALARVGMLAFSQRVGLAGTAHVSGTLAAGRDPSTSVVDAEGRVHGMRSLYVVDGSILPRSSRVNPSLTIYAWALRTTELLAARLQADVPAYAE
jgi:choline dehydrogenase-like flavoprotein